MSAWRFSQPVRALNRPAHLCLAAVLVVAAIVRLRGITFGLPHTQARPDETFVIDVSLDFLRGRAPAFYDYPWLFMGVVTVLYLAYFVWGFLAGRFSSLADLIASWPVDWPPFFLVSRGLSAVAGVASVLALYLLGRRLWGERTALVAAFFLSIAFLHVRDSHFGTTDVAMTLLVIVSLVILLRAVSGEGDWLWTGSQAQRSQAPNRPWSYALAGAVAGLASATKYSAIFAVMPMAAIQALRAWDANGSDGPRWRVACDRRLAAFGSAFAVAFLLGTPFLLFDFDGFLSAMRELQYSMTVGTPGLQLDHGWSHHLEFSLRYGMGVPLLVAGIAGIVSLVRTEPRLALVVLSFPITYYAVAGSSRNLFFRYALPLIPFLCLTAARLIGLIADRVIVRAGRWRPAMQAFAVSLIALAVAWPSASRAWQLGRVMAETDNRVLVARWVEAYVPPGSSVLQSGSQYGHAQFDRRFGYQRWVWDKTRKTFMVEGRRAKGRPDWILLQASPLPSETQAIVKDFLRDGYTEAWRFPALDLDGSGLAFDRQDAFFVPVDGFRHVERPGPNFTLYKLVGGPPTHAHIADRQ
jgi:hypothetical protein